MNKNVHGGDCYRNQIEYDFSININPLGMPGGCFQAACEGISLSGRYPDDSGEELCLALAGKEGISSENILLGDGAVQTDADQRQLAPLHGDAGGDVAPGIGELLPDVILALGAGGALYGAHVGALILGSNLTAVGADDAGKGPLHCTLTSRSPSVSSFSAGTVSWIISAGRALGNFRRRTSRPF